MGTGILSGNVTDVALENAGALIPALVTQDHQYWRIVTGAFLHLSLLHIGVNMISLWSLGRFIEMALGSWRTLLIYAVSLVGSGLGIVYLSDPNTVTVGASGAIFGLFGALFAIGLKLGRPGMEMVKASIPILLLNLVITFTVPFISKAAHVAGLLTGFILTFAIYFPPKRFAPVAYDTATGDALDTQYETPHDHIHGEP